MVHTRGFGRCLALALFILLASAVSPALALSARPGAAPSDAVVYRHFFPYPTSYTHADLRFINDRLTAIVVRPQPFQNKTLRFSHEAPLLRPRPDFRARILRASELVD